MSGSANRAQASRKLISFIQTFTNLLEQQLGEVRSEMSHTVKEVMDAISDLSNKTEQKKREANEILVSTYTAPGEEQRDAMDAIQASVTEIFEKAQAQQVTAREENELARARGKAEISGASDILEQQMRRSGGLFSKHMEALGTLDNELQDLIFRMVGALSQDDVFSQRIEHVAQCLHALQTSLAYLLVDFDTRCTDREVDQFTDDLETYALKTYTMLQEKDLHMKFFKEKKKAS